MEFSTPHKNSSESQKKGKRYREEGTGKEERGEREIERQNGDVRGGERKNYNTYLSIPQVP